MTRALLCWTRALLLGLALSGPAFADGAEPRARAEAHLKEGVQAYREGRYEEALGSYQKAAELAPTAAGPYREMGKAYEALGRKDEARAAYEEYLRRLPSAEDAPEIKSRLALLGPAALAAPQEAQPAALTPAPITDAAPRKRSPWLYIGGSAALIGVGVGVAIVVDTLESGKDRGNNNNDDDDDDDDDDSRSRARSFVFTLPF